MFGFARMLSITREDDFGQSKLANTLEIEPPTGPPFQDCASASKILIYHDLSVRFPHTPLATDLFFVQEITALFVMFQLSDFDAVSHGFWWIQSPWRIGFFRKLGIPRSSDGCIRSLPIIRRSYIISISEEYDNQI